MGTAILQYEKARNLLLFGETSFYFFSIDNWLLLISGLIACLAFLILAIRKIESFIEKIRSRFMGSNFEIEEHTFPFIPFKSNGFMDGENTFLGLDKTNRPFWIDDEARSMHILALGRTGSGKSKLLQNMIYQGMCRNDKRGLIFIDGKGDKEERDIFCGMAKEANRLHEVKIIDFVEKDKSWIYNPLLVPDGLDPIIVAEKVYSIFKCSEEFYKNFQKSIFVPIFLLLHDVLGQFTFVELYNAFENTDFRIKLLNECKDQGLADSIRRKSKVMGKDFSKSLMGLEAWLSKYRSIPQLNRIPTEGDNNIVVDMAQELKNGGLVYIRLPFSLYPERSKDVGMLLLQEIQYLLGLRQAKGRDLKPFEIMADEFSKYAHENFIDCINTSRSAKIYWTIATQTLADLKKVSEEFAEGVWDNTRIKIALSQNNPDLVEKLSNELGTYQQVERTERNSNTLLGTKFSTGESSNRLVESFVLHPNKIKNLHKHGQAYCIGNLLGIKDQYIGINIGMLDVTPVEFTPDTKIFNIKTNIGGNYVFH
ncbi:MAG: TraM recognition domain-containing protein [Deltaproteobacteria bacterium]|nr:TraM recognition domain-containing protein [Deltaproteobacteria bacterium]